MTLDPPPIPPRPDGLRQEVFEGIVVARRLRHELGLAPTEPVPCVLDLAETGLGLDVVLMKLAGRLSGLYLPTRPRPIVIVQTAHPVPRQRFTLAHELGHHALGHPAAPRIQETEPTPASPADLSSHYRPQRQTDPQERAANAFAGELLTPEGGSRTLLAGWADEPPLDQAVRLSAHFGVSTFSAAVRLQMIGVIDRDGMATLRGSFSAGDHVPRYPALGLDEHDDALRRHHAGGDASRCSPAARATIRRLRLELAAR